MIIIIIPNVDVRQFRSLRIICVPDTNLSPFCVLLYCRNQRAPLFPALSSSLGSRNGKPKFRDVGQRLPGSAFLQSEFSPLLRTWRKHKHTMKKLLYRSPTLPTNSDPFLDLTAILIIWKIYRSMFISIYAPITILCSGIANGRATRPPVRKSLQILHSSLIYLPRL